MRKYLFIIFLSFSFLFGTNLDPKIENLMGSENYKIYNKLIKKIFKDGNYSIVEIVDKLKNNGLLELFFDKAKLVHTKFNFVNDNSILGQKLLNDSLTTLGYYYFYPIEIRKKGDNYSVNLEFKSEHLIDPVFLSKEMIKRGCKVLDISREGESFNYKFDCSNGKIKEAVLLTDKNKRLIKPKGVYWIDGNGFDKIVIKTLRIDFWHPSVWFYDENMNLINNFRKNQKIVSVTLNIPPACKYIKITDIYSGENFKRGIIIKGL